MRSVKLRTSDKKKVQEKLDLVIEKLMNLGGPENGEELAEGGEAIGFFKRDFGIREWDWPQGVGRLAPVVSIKTVALSFKIETSILNSAPVS